MKEFLAYTVFSLVFNTGYELSGPLDLGLNAKYFSFEENGKEYMTISFIYFSVETQENMEMTDSEMLNYAKSTFLGTAKPASEFKERVILGSNIKGELLSTSIPVASDMEVYFVTMESGDKVCIGFKSIKELSADKREAIINEILSSLK